ncbi:Rab11 family GTPase [Achlya hypogyna]|uniref:Rab11 family GTPase n=1 Tax=Achlya hypogyna TaxID=1202772 RepID=A0A1V9Y6A2_ACHHY|nr:Rab11 family GTPase [Achlya hypogyna]
MEVIHEAVADTVYKIIMIGSGAVGKTNLIGVGARGCQFNDMSPMTTNPEFVTVKVKRPDWKPGQANQYITAHLWDTAGQERYQAISASHYRRVNGAIIVYDVSNKQSFKEVYPGLSNSSLSWLRALKQNSDPDLLAAVMLMENKADLLKKGEPRQPSYVQEADVDKLLLDAVFKDPTKGLGWLHDAPSADVHAYRVANALMFARTSAATNECELFELNERKVAAVNEMFQQQSDAIGYEKTEQVTTVTKAIEALVLRIYERSKDMTANGSKVKGKPFKIVPTPPPTETTDACC